MIKKAVIPAAGYGTRFLPITKAIPKEMLPIIDKPAIEIIVDEAIASGITDLLIIISNNKGAITNYFDRNLELEHILLEKGKDFEYGLIKNVASKLNIYYVSQKEQLGLGHAILHAKSFVGNEPFAVLLGDDVFVSDEKPALKQLMDAYEKTHATILGTMVVPMEKTHQYGICVPKEGSKKPIVELSGVVEKPKVAPSQSAIAGRYILTPKIFDYLQDQQKGAGNEIQLTDAILRLMAEEKVYSLDIHGKRYDIGSKIGYIEAIIDFALNREDLKDEVRSLLKTK
ncbi:UDP glucose pyrophosphorylase [Alteracholeplasma palmae J233]|uniref:UTP--glucose-1-phosphate uridylyltransferase n=1 Tax=Alteracholeplasma palmae (strain ATCC 49389 / J233) TaxID=1318466 RepID=U4KPX3_ALTPJ|nr:UTP--glucose-1-phosphate uridylyltransferase GalU [Alteracholeplasma palmae]CCV64350.1 UDP glucose pyrophosphorylase [Alteracholeplasma palmae J233]